MQVESPPATGTPAQELLRRIAGGDRDALATLYHQHQRALFRYLCGLIPDRGLAEEALQDTLLAVWRSAGSFQGRSALRTWLFGIARRQAHNALRRRGLPVVDAEDLLALADPAQGTEDQALQRAELGELAGAIRRLSLVHREVLALTFVSGLSYEEIAGVLDVPEGTVKSRLSNARRALRRAVEERDGDTNR